MCVCGLQVVQGFGVEALGFGSLVSTGYNHHNDVFVIVVTMIITIVVMSMVVVIIFAMVMAHMFFKSSCYNPNDGDDFHQIFAINLMWPGVSDAGGLFPGSWLEAEQEGGPGRFRVGGWQPHGSGRRAHHSSHCIPAQAQQGLATTWKMTDFWPSCGLLRFTYSTPDHFLSLELGILTQEAPCIV